MICSFNFISHTVPPDDSLMCKPEFTRPLNIDLEVIDGERLLLECTVKGDPDPQITWSKNGKSISSSEIMNLKYKNGVATLTINEIYPEDEGTYTCTATNSVGATETKCNLKIKPLENGGPNLRHQSSAGCSANATDKPPKIVSHLESRFVKDGDAITLACRIIGGGSEKFDVVWLHNNKEIKPSKDFQYTNEANIYKLQIAEIFPEDAGTYTCEAFNDVGESFSTCTIGVIVPGEVSRAPEFTKFPGSVTIQEGESCRFECQLEEAPLSLNWLKDGKPLDVTSGSGDGHDQSIFSRYNFTKDGNLYSFEIISCQHDDIGQYQAKAIGKKGETFSSFSVNVCAKE